MDKIFGGGANAGQGVEIVVVQASLLNGARRWAARDGVGEAFKNGLVDDLFEVVEVHHHAIAGFAGSVENGPT